MLTNLKKELDTLFNVSGSNEEWKIFSSHLKLEKFQKKDFLRKEGEIEDSIFLVQQGMVRYFLKKDNKEITFQFGFQNDFVSNYESFSSQTPSKISIQALSTTYAYVFKINEMNEVFKQSPTSFHIYQAILQKSLNQKSQRELSLLTDSPKDLYLKILEKEPHLIQQIPLKYLASYIGITPQALSRIRKNISVTT